MKTMSTFVPALAVMTVMAVVGATALPAQESRCPDGDEKVVRIEIAVDREAGKATVTPEEATIWIGGDHAARRACWIVTGMAAGDELRFDDKDPESDDFFPGLKRTVKAASPFANSGNPSKAGTWVYGVAITDEAGDPVASVDPVVVIKDGTASGG